MKKKKYNFRSVKNDSLQIPIQLQCSDNDLMANLLGSNSMLETQQYSNIASLGSKLDCSWVVDHSDSDSVGTHIHFFH